MTEIASARTAQERLKLCHTLLSLREKINAGGPRKIQIGVLAGRRVASIRRVLLGGSAASMLDELMTPEAASARLLAELQAAQGKPPHERVAVAAYAKGIMETLNAIHYAEEQIGMGESRQYSPELLQAIEAILPGDGYAPAWADVVIDDFIGRGGFGNEVRDELEKALADGENVDKEVGLETLALSADYEKTLIRRKSIEDELLKLKSLDATNQEAVEAAHKSYRDFMIEVYNPVTLARNDVLLAARKKTGEAYARAGTKMIDRVVSASPVTPEAAAEWAKAQEITPQAVARLRAIGYPLVKVRSDMAEFHRITGGRLGMVRIHSKGDRRANAADISAHGKVGTINLSASFDKRVLWHELGHHLEADPVAKIAAGRFIRRRSADGEEHPLRNLTKNAGYRPDEKAYKGDFFHPYVGKIYLDGATEVFSMGVESFSDPETLVRRVAQDHKTMAFVSGFLQTPISPMARAHTELRAALREIRGDATDATKTSLEALLKELADSVQVTPLAVGLSRELRWILDSNDMKIIGEFDQPSYYLATGKVRNNATKRKSGGVMLLRMDGLRVNVVAQAAGSDQSTMRAMYALYKKTGTMPLHHMMSSEEYVRKQAAA